MSNDICWCCTNLEEQQLFDNVVQVSPIVQAIGEVLSLEVVLAFISLREKNIIRQSKDNV